MQWTRRRLGQTALAAMAAACTQQSGANAPLIVHGGKIYTGVAATPTVEAIRIEGNRVAAIGEGAEPVASKPEVFAAFVRDEIKKWDEVGKAANIQPTE